MTNRGGGRGSSIGDATEFDRQMRNLGIQVMRFENVADRMFDNGTPIVGLSIRVKGDDRADYLVVVRARTADGPVVSFHSADTLGEALRGMVARFENGSVKWKEDEYAKQ